jgi:transcription initiation factor TFIIIB Brf1 subunit/transcription initiation factor TFIIB
LEEKEKLQLVKNLGFSNLNDFKSTIRQLTSSYNLFVHKYSYVLKLKDSKKYLAEAFSKVANEKNLFKTKQPDCLAVWGAMMAACLINANLLEQQFGVEFANIYYISCVTGAFVFLAGCEGIV